MDRIEQVFGRRRVFLPVVHTPPCTTHLVPEMLAVASVGGAVEAGADGVFLINQGPEVEDADVFARLVRRVRQAFPHLWIGANLLGHTPVTAVRMLEGVDGLWSDAADTAGTLSSGHLRAERHARHFWGLYFGGVAFKYQPRVADELLGSAARCAVRYGVDVVTTSGPGTGEPADPAKLRRMRLAIGDHALALASGVTVENVGEYLPYVDAFLVATGIEERFGVLDLGKTRALAERIHRY